MTSTKEDDTLSIDLGPPQEASSGSIDNELYLHVDPETLKLVGLELTHFSDNLREGSNLAAFVQHILAAAGYAVLLPQPSEPNSVFTDLSAEVGRLIAG